MDNADSESSTAAFKIRNLDHFRTQKNRESLGCSSIQKTGPGYKVVFALISIC